MYAVLSLFPLRTQAHDTHKLVLHAEEEMHGVKEKNTKGTQQHGHQSITFVSEHQARS